MMTLLNFDARVRADRLIGFDVPLTVLAHTATFNVYITQPGTANSPGTLFAIVSFNATIPANRRVIFTVPSSVPLGSFHFMVIITSTAPTQTAYQIKALPAKKKKTKKRARR